ncbi:Endonuclease/exonuclease/phosphatase [Epithele typhae]|uniref:Endonuclease/exonuclease/phosphatase n=1 Tax=Epithele typhae TaxID=378194 RepID=UPI00200723D4|nr:Endonuclease/exonuclease/phosphatase [Epithele typhae]KAH9910806.1 Endonuclease/exonuclease/phosphatase [Epithele typhae]
MKERNIAVLLLQETHLTQDRRIAVTKLFGSRVKIYMSAPDSDPTKTAGVAIVVNKKLLNTDGIQASEIIPGRALQLAIPLPGNEAPRQVLCIYAPADSPEARTVFFTQLREYYKSHPNQAKPVIIAGDFNNTEDAIDRFPQQNPDSSLSALDDLKLSLGLLMTDGWRATNPTAKEHTYRARRNDQIHASRLDRIYVNADLHEHAAREWEIITPGVRTDHSMVTVTVTSQHAPTRGKGRTVFPTKLLKDKKLAARMKREGLKVQAELDDLCEGRATRTNDHNPQTLLKNFKSAILKIARDREREVVPRILAEIRELEEELRKKPERRKWLPFSGKLANYASHDTE